MKLQEYLRTRKESLLTSISTKKAIDKDLEKPNWPPRWTNSRRRNPGLTPVANTQDIRRRIKSIRNTAQITKAMQMVAASKMRKAQHARAGRPALRRR